MQVTEGRTRPERRRSRQRRGGLPQAVISGLALGIVLWSALYDGGRTPTVTTVMMLATLVLFAAQAVLDIRHGLPHPARRVLPVLLPYAAVLGWLTAQAVPGWAPELAHPLWALAPEGADPAISAHPDATRQLVMRLTGYAMLFWILLRGAAVAHDGAISYIRAIALYGTAIALYGLFSWSVGYNILLDENTPRAVVQASFGNQNIYATHAIFGLLANMAAFFHAVGAERLRLRDFLEAFFTGGWLYAFGALVCLSALMLTFSRSGITAGLLGFAVLAWGVRRGKGWTRAAWAAWGVPLALVGVMGLVFGAGVIEKHLAIGDGGRFAVYGRTLEAAFARGWLGHGGGAYPEAFRAWMPVEEARYEWIWAHNSYVENAFEFGLPAAALFYLGLGLVGWRLLRGVLTRRRNLAAPACALAALVAAGFHAGFDFGLQFPANAALLAAILGIGWGQAFPTRRQSG